MYFVPDTGRLGELSLVGITQEGAVMMQGRLAAAIHPKQSVHSRTRRLQQSTRRGEPRGCEKPEKTGCVSAINKGESRLLGPCEILTILTVFRPVRKSQLGSR
jgi:hypothetical protein